METGFLNDATGKLGLAHANKPMLIGMAAILVLAAVAVVHVLSGAAAASDFKIESSETASFAEGDSGKAHETYVHVSGAVESPGLYQVEVGSRVADAVNAAGGFSEDADESACNLARIIDDGEHIVIPSFEETASATEAGTNIDGSEKPTHASVLNINTATAEQLESLPGIGAVTAQKIIADREANGSFNSIEDLTRVSGIGQKKLNALESLICV